MSQQASTRPPITCHVLNTVTGLPASNVPVSLTLLRPYGPSVPLTAITNADGRVNAWTTPAGGPSLQDIFDNAKEHSDKDSSSIASGAPPQRGRIVRRGSVAEELKIQTGEGAASGGSGSSGRGEMVWKLEFDVGEYFKGEGFWTEVEVRFRTVVSGGGEDARTHWHVPLLLSPWSYTTYRGS